MQLVRLARMFPNFVTDCIVLLCTYLANKAHLSDRIMFAVGIRLSDRIITGMAYADNIG